MASADRTLAGALAAALTAFGDIETTAYAADAQELSGLLDLGPNVVVIVLPLGDEPDSGIISKSSIRSGVLVLGPEDSESMIPVLEAGALGYLDSRASFQEIADAIRAVAAGTPVIPPSMLGSLLRHVVRRRRLEQRALERLEILTNREREVFELVAGGLDKHRIAEALFISPETARTHIHNILTKLELHSQVDLLALAAQCGLAIGAPNG